MRNRLRVNLGNVLLSLSDAMELVSPEIAQHQQRTAFMVWQMGKAAGLPGKTIEEMFLAALLHDVGALSVEEKETLHQVSLTHSEEIDVEKHCLLGQALLSKVPWLKSSAEIVRYHHTYLNKWDGFQDSTVMVPSQMLLLADHLERHLNRNKYVLLQDKDLKEYIISLKGGKILPEVIDHFLAASGREEFWLDLVSPRLFSLLLHEGPYRTLEADVINLGYFSEIFRNIIDFRSRFTATHSTGVATCAVLLASLFGLSESEIQMIKIAGDLHDLGKLGVPNLILEKRGKLAGEEFSIIKSHTYYTYQLLNTIGGLEEIAEWAAFHHEKLDGSGYPFHCTARELDTGSRIMAVADLFTAIAEDRPYRKGMSPGEIKRIMHDFADRRTLDARIIGLLLDHFEEIDEKVKTVQSEALDFYNRQFKTGYVRKEHSHEIIR